MLKGVTLVLSAVFLLGAASTVPPALLRNDAPALEIRTSISPVTRDPIQLLGRPQPGMYRCTVTVHDEPGSHRVFGSLDVVVGPGETREASKLTGPMRVALRVAINASADRADTTVTVYRDGVAITRQTSTVWLERTATGIVPLH